MKQKAIWISWEQHRRTTELSNRLNVRLFTMLPGKIYALKVIINSLKTLWVLLLQRPDTLFIQNPSIMLNLIACWLKPIFRYKLVADRHSNFRLSEALNPQFKWRLFHRISRYTIKKSDLTIVTNTHLKELVESWGGRAVVLPDAIPHLPLSQSGAYSLSHETTNIVYICSYAIDEPLEAVKEAFALNPTLNFFITGKPKNTNEAEWSNNVTLTGFLREDEYQSLLNEADIILVLTTADHLLLCGAYEAVSLGKPLVTSDSETLKNYFSNGAVYCDNSADGISDAIRTAVSNNSQITQEMIEFRATIDKTWEIKFQILLSEVYGN